MDNPAHKSGYKIYFALCGNSAIFAGNECDMKTLRLKEILKERGISGSELARRLNVTPQYIHGAIREDFALSVKKCQEIASILDVPLASLFEGYEDGRYIICPHCGERIKIEVKP